MGPIMNHGTPVAASTTAKRARLAMILRAILRAPSSFPAAICARSHMRW